MTKRPKIIAMVQLPPPLHGAAKMNQFAIDALAKDFDLRLIELRFARKLSMVNRFSLRKILIALWLLGRLMWTLPRAEALYICFAPSGFAYCRDSLYVLLAKIFRVPAILHLHGRGLSDMRRSKWADWHQKVTFKGQTVILLSESLRSEIDGLQCKSVIVRNCLGNDAFRPTTVKPWAPHNPVRLLWLSNLFHAKGIETLLAACAILRNQGIVCDLTIAGAEGDISERDLFALLSKYQMQATTNWLGPVFGTAKQTAFENADLFAFPSHYANEAQPLVVLEAMAAGVPVITSNIATLPEFVRNGETGRLCPAKNPAKLATEIIAALTAPKHTNAMRDAAYHMCQRDFSHSRFATNLCQLVDSIIKNR